jgi:hypothetical protein
MKVGSFSSEGPAYAPSACKNRPNPSKVGSVFALRWVMRDVSFGRICTPAAPARQYSYLSSHGNLVPRVVAERYARGSLSNFVPELMLRKP